MNFEKVLVLTFRNSALVRKFLFSWTSKKLSLVTFTSHLIDLKWARKVESSLKRLFIRLMPFSLPFPLKHDNFSISFVIYMFTGWFTCFHPNWKRKNSYMTITRYQNISSSSLQLRHSSKNRLKFKHIKTIAVSGSTWDDNKNIYTYTHDQALFSYIFINIDRQIT